MSWIIPKLVEEGFHLLSLDAQRAIQLSDLEPLTRPLRDRIAELEEKNLGIHLAAQAAAMVGGERIALLEDELRELRRKMVMIGLEKENKC